MITTDGVATTCSTANFTGELAGPSETVELAPTYSGCWYMGTVPVTIAPNGCKYRFHAGKELEEEETFEGAVDVVCPGSETIVVTAKSVLGECEVKIGAQSGFGELKYLNEPEAESFSRVGVEVNVKNFKYTKTKDTGFCPLGGLGEKSDGTYVGEEIVKAEDQGQKKGVVVAPKTKLYEDHGFMICNAAWPAKTTVESTPATVTFELESIQVICKKNKFSGVTTALEAAPLTFDPVTLSFASCETKKMTSCKDVAVSYLEAWINAVAVWAPPAGWLHIEPLKLEFECGTEVKCWYGINMMKFDIVSKVNGEATMTPTSSLGQIKFAGEAGCSKAMNWVGDAWQMAPKPLWVTQFPIKK